MSIKLRWMEVQKFGGYFFVMDISVHEYDSS